MINHHTTILPSKKFIASGILEAYCLGVATELQVAEVKIMELIYKDVQEEINLIQSALKTVRTKELKLAANNNN